MSRRLSWVSTAAIAALTAFLLSGPSQASVLYSNGSPNGTVDAWTINMGDAVGDSFVLGSSATVNGASFTAWLNGATFTSVDWAILDNPPNLSGRVLSSGTASTTGTFLFINSYGADIYSEQIGFPDLNLAAGTYWFELQNAVVSSGKALWDINGGPSSAFESIFGDVTTNCSIGVNGRCSTSFSILDTTAVPEPTTLALFGGGLGFLGLLRWRRKKKVATVSAA